MQNKKYAVIDVGSNSVRLMISDGIQTFYKRVAITELAEGLANSSVLKKEAVERTAKAVYLFSEEAEKAGAEKIFVFATAAARRAENGVELVREIKKLSGLETEIISGEKEAEIGVRGVLCGRDGGVIDVGGASTEISVVKDGKTVYIHSFDIGSVKLTDACGSDRRLSEKTASYIISPPQFSETDFYAVGGTATSVAAIMQELSPYDPKKTDGYAIELDKLSALEEKLFSMDTESKKRLKGLQPERAKVISCGVAVLKTAMEKLNVKRVTVSEKDNLEGYLAEKLKNE